MNFNKYINKGLLAMSTVAALTFSSCVNDLDTTPVDPDSGTIGDTYKNITDLEGGLAKVYGGLALSGQKGPAGDPDLGGLDEGASQYIRKYWEFQELPTDEALNGWGDPGQPAISQVNWTASNPVVRILYYRMMYQVTLSNQFINDSKTVDISGADQARLDQMTAEARFLRALSYWHALDFFGNGIPFTDENTAIGSEAPEPAGSFEGTEIYNFVEAELKAITGETDPNTAVQLKEIGNGFVGQADKGAAYMLLAKLYMNAEVYTKTPQYAKAKEVLNKIVGAYSLESDYVNNFLADNYLSREIIFSINFDGLYTQTWGGTTFLVHAAVGGEMDAKKYGIDGGWGGHRSTVELVKKFEASEDIQVDNRGMFFKHNRENTDLTDFKDGYAVTKYSNTTRLGYTGKDPNLTFVDTNFPMFRLADAYLMLAEIDGRTNGSITDVTNLEQIWDRAQLSSTLKGEYKAKAQSVEWGSFILDERARELYWEGHRRTDLVRFGKFTQGYSWPHKGGSPVGTMDVDEKYNTLPIPASELIANPKLRQNPLWN